MFHSLGGRYLDLLTPLDWKLLWPYLFVISASASAIPCCPPLVEEILPFLDDFASKLDPPSTFNLRSRYRFPIWDDLFNLVAAFLRRGSLAPPSPGGGGGGPRIPGCMGGGGAGTPPLGAPIGGGGGGGAIFPDPMGGGGGGG